MRKESALPLPHKSCVGKKAKNEIRKMADKASNYATHKAMTREELGDSTKYVKIISKDKNGEKIKPVVEIDKEKISSARANDRKLINLVTAHEDKSVTSHEVSNYNQDFIMLDIIFNNFIF